MDGTNIAAVPLMCTYSGKRFNPINPNIDDISIIDIAHSLSNVCRYGGQCKEFYCVAQHSVVCAWEAPYPIKKKLLLHDASEGYIGDIISPLKATPQYEAYREIEDNLMAAIYERFDLEEDTEEEKEEIHRIDLLVRHTEMRDFGSIPEEFWIDQQMLDYNIKPLSPKESKILFLKEFSRLFGYGYNGWRYLQ
jgi:5'-deoxynucleotidase YfbR-like HD superfamily hydrolase